VSFFFEKEKFLWILLRIAMADASKHFGIPEEGDHLLLEKLPED
jgi:hypothetical protein